MLSPNLYAEAAGEGLLYLYRVAFYVFEHEYPDFEAC